MLETLGVACSRGDRTLFSQLDLFLGGGRLLRVMGANGSGKTSLLRILCGLRSPHAGEVRWRGASIASSEAREEFHRELVYIGHLNGLKDEFSAMENLAASAVLAGMASDPVPLRRALERMDLAHIAGLPARHLSQGQRRRVALARLLLAADRPLWILDEPFNALDAKAITLVEQVLAGHAAAGGAVVFTTHFEPAIAAERIDRLDLDHLDAGSGQPC